MDQQSTVVAFLLLDVSIVLWDVATAGTGSMGQMFQPSFQRFNIKVFKLVSSVEDISEIVPGSLSSAAGRYQSARMLCGM